MTVSSYEHARTNGRGRWCKAMPTLRQFTALAALGTVAAAAVACVASNDAAPEDSERETHCSISALVSDAGTDRDILPAPAVTLSDAEKAKFAPIPEAIPV